jgi:hypothetical protein
MTPQEITAAVQQGSVTHRQAIAIFAALHGASLPSSALMLPCEACGTPFPFSEAHSYLVWAPMPGHSAVAGFQCEQEQHYGCSEACGVALAQRCLSEHILPAAQAKRAAAQRAQAAANQRAG